MSEQENIIFFWFTRKLFQWKKLHGSVSLIHLAPLTGMVSCGACTRECRNRTEVQQHILGVTFQQTDTGPAAATLCSWCFLLNLSSNFKSHLYFLEAQHSPAWNSTIEWCLLWKTLLLEVMHRSQIWDMLYDHSCLLKSIFCISGDKVHRSLDYLMVVITYISLYRQSLYSILDMVILRLRDESGWWKAWWAEALGPFPESLFLWRGAQSCALNRCANWTVQTDTESDAELSRFIGNLSASQGPPLIASNMD